jgi:hypothetical protein
MYGVVHAADEVSAIAQAIASKSQKNLRNPLMLCIHLAPALFLNHPAHESSGGQSNVVWKAFSDSHRGFDRYRTDVRARSG